MVIPEGNSLTQEEIDAILALEPGKRSDPSTYLSEQEIADHLADALAKNDNPDAIEIIVPPGTDGLRSLKRFLGVRVGTVDQDTLDNYRETTITIRDTDGNILLPRQLVLLE